MTTRIRSNDIVPNMGGISKAFELLRMPFTFIQDDLLTADSVIRNARERGITVDLDDLRDLHGSRILIPFYRVTNTPVLGRRLDVQVNGNLDHRRIALEAAAEGRLRDCAEEGYSAAWPYERPDDNDDPRWWNGFLYSSWQLLELHRALFERDLLRQLPQWARHSAPPKEIARRHDRTLALAALTPRYLPGILSRLGLPGGVDRDALERFRLHADVLSLVDAVGFEPSDLRKEAEYLLLEAGRDPLRDWLPLVRFASYNAWMKLRGEALDCLWLRVGAEVLLRAHEDLAADGHVEPLPNVSGSASVTALHRRLGRKDDSPRPLEQVLGNFGLSPHPRVLLVIEGKTERFHVRSLLEAFGLGRPEQVRVQQCKGSRVNPQLLARYAVTPRIGKKIGEAWEMTATPTALVIAMDPENRWETPQKCEDERRKIKEAIREEVELQGGRIGDDALDLQVSVLTWGLDKYELANFSDDELLPAMVRLANGADVGTEEWEVRIRQQLQGARQDHTDIGTVTGPLHIDKTELAKTLWPILLTKCELELASDNVKTPVLKLILKVDELVAQLSAGSYLVTPP